MTGDKSPERLTRRLEYTNDALFIAYMSGHEEVWTAASASAVHDKADTLKLLHPEKYKAFKTAQKMGAI